MLPDTIMDMAPEESIAYVNVLAAVATCDGKFTNEEMSAYEARTASLLFQPNVRARLQSMLNERVDVEEYLSSLGENALRLILRDAILMAACDGAYVAEEMEIISKIASAARVDDDTLNQLYNWVTVGWDWFRSGHQILAIQQKLATPAQ